MVRHFSYVPPPTPAAAIWYSTVNLQHFFRISDAGFRGALAFGGLVAVYFSVGCRGCVLKFGRLLRCGTPHDCCRGKLGIERCRRIHAPAGVADSPPRPLTAAAQVHALSSVYRGRRNFAVDGFLGGVATGAVYAGEAMRFDDLF